MSFSSDKDRLLARVTQINDDLHQHLDRASGVTRKAVSKPKVYLQERHSQAATFYECLARYWQCGCSSSHTVGITVQPAALKSKTTRPDGYFDVIFETEMKRRQLRIQVEDICVEPTPLFWPPRSPVPIINIEAAVDLKGQMISRDQHKLASRMANEKGIGSLVMAPLPVSDPLKAAPVQKSILRRMIRKLRTSLKIKQNSLSPSLLTTKSNQRSVPSLGQSPVSGIAQVLADSISLSTPPER